VTLVIWPVTGPANTPVTGSGVVRDPLGLPKLGWLNAFCASARIPNFMLSQGKLKVLPAERLMRSTPGPTSGFLPMSPNSPFAGFENAAGLYHSPSVRPPAGLVLTPATRFG